MIDVANATTGDLDHLVALEQQLFLDDAGSHEQYVDLTWPRREGRRDFERMLDDESSLVLVAKAGGAIVGHLVGYTSPPSPTRQEVEFAILRSLFVDADHRRKGVAGRLTRQFLAWARDRGCVEAHVSSYADNTPAQDLYRGQGFEARSVLRVLSLDPDQVSATSAASERLRKSTTTDS